jgi:2-iminobutanoate/2-iminopropanoate deaminase
MLIFAYLLHLLHFSNPIMAARKNFNTAKAPRMSQVFPQAVIAEKFIFLSGTAGLDPHTGRIVSDSFEDQTRQAFENIRAILEDAGSNMSKIVKTTVFMVQGNDFSIVNKVYGEFFPDNAPARSVPQVMPFPGGILVSVECIALQ